MTLQQLRNVNFGAGLANATGALGVGYTVYDEVGVVTLPRTTSGVYQIITGSGIYAAYITFPNAFRGQVLWDTGTIFSSSYFATEQYNVEENNPKIDDTWQMVNDVTGSIELLRDITAGRWKMVSNQMIFYREDNVTEVARFNLFDDAGAPSMDAVFERVKIP